MVEMTDHARTRMRQRGIRKQDVDFILQHGSSVPDGVIG
jgi:hypothetical protein